MQPTVLITGSTGFLGAHIVLEFLKSGYKVKATYRNKSSIAKANKIFSYYPSCQPYISAVEWVSVDLFSLHEVESALAGVDYVVHAAAEVSFNSCRKNAIIENNTRITAILVDSAIKNNVRKFCHISSIATLGSTLNGEPITEDTSWSSVRGNSGYSISKFYSEMEVWRGVNSGLNAVILNPSVILGPGDWASGGSPAFFTTVDKGMPFYTNGVSGFVDVRDVAKAARTVIESGAVSDRFIVSSENISFRGLFTQIAHRLGKRAPNIYAYSPMSKTFAAINMLWATVTKREPKITLDSVRASAKVHRYSGDKLAKTLDFKYTPISETIEFTGECFLKDKK